MNKREHSKKSSLRNVHWILIVSIVLVVSLIIFLLYDFYYDFDDSVIRAFSAEKVSSGAEFKVQYQVNLNSSQQFYLFEDAVPSGFEILDCEHDVNNEIKVIVIQGAVSKVYECTLKAPPETGSYKFKGQYALSDKRPSNIKGKNRVTIE